MQRLIKGVLVFFCCCCHIGVSSELTVSTPQKGAVIVSGRTFTVEWDLVGDVGDSNRFGVDLFHDHLSYDMGGEGPCGCWVTALCPYGEHGCTDSTGDYDVVLPEPLANLPQSGYRIGVWDIENEGDDGVGGCSPPFTLLREEDVSQRADLNVTAPVDGDVAFIGDSYDVEFDYDNGVGSSTDRFDIDLWMVDGPGDCGTYVSPLCDKWMLGCRDSGGSHGISIPMDTDPGFYRIRVARFEDESVFDCSGVFEVVEGGYSYSYF